MTKKVVSFLRKEIWVTPSVAAPDDTNPSDATALFRNEGSSNVIGAKRSAPLRSEHFKQWAQTVILDLIELDLNHSATCGDPLLTGTRNFNKVEQCLAELLVTEQIWQHGFRVVRFSQS